MGVDLKSDNRASREQLSHEGNVIHESYDDDSIWEETDLLSTKNIPPRDGFVQRWVRTMVRGVDDHTNVMKKYNKGWRPRLLSTVPKGQHVMSIGFHGQDVVGIHGSILMERPKVIQEREKRAVKEQVNLLLQSVNENMFKVHEPGKGFSRPAMSLDERVSVGRKPIIDD